MSYSTININPVRRTHALSYRFCLHLDEYLAPGRNDNEVMMPRLNAISTFTAHARKKFMRDVAQSLYHGAARVAGTGSSAEGDLINVEKLS